MCISLNLRRMFYIAVISLWKFKNVALTSELLIAQVLHAIYTMWLFLNLKQFSRFEKKIIKERSLTD